MATAPRLAILMVVSVSAALGCGRSDRVPLGQVRGRVTYQSKPILRGTIIFEVPGARPATGKIVDGRITEVTTYDPGDGVPVGTAAIAVFATESAAESAAGPGGSPPAHPAQAAAPGQGYMGGGARSRIPSRYNDPSRSGLSRRISKGANEIELELGD